MASAETGIAKPRFTESGKRGYTINRVRVLYYHEDSVEKKKIVLFPDHYAGIYGSDRTGNDAAYAAASEGRGRQRIFLGCIVHGDFCDLRDRPDHTGYGDLLVCFWADSDPGIEELARWRFFLS